MHWQSNQINQINWIFELSSVSHCQRVWLSMMSTTTLMRKREREREKERERERKRERFINLPMESIPLWSCYCRLEQLDFNTVGRIKVNRNLWVSHLDIETIDMFSFFYTQNHQIFPNCFELAQNKRMRGREWKIIIITVTVSFPDVTRELQEQWEMTEPMYIWSINSWQRSQGHTMGKGQCLQQMGTLASQPQANGTELDPVVYHTQRPTRNRLKPAMRGLKW